jgi:hypothetical protein
MPSMTPHLDHYLSPATVARLAQQYDINAIECAWRKGNYGTLQSQGLGKCVGLATIEQATESYEDSEGGYIQVELNEENRIENIPLTRGPLTVWVRP